VRGVTWSDQSNGDWIPEVNGHQVDWMDLADDQFVTGPRAWQAAASARPTRNVI
jgi:hypothetical protein